MNINVREWQLRAIETQMHILNLSWKKCLRNTMSFFTYWMRGLKHFPQVSLRVHSPSRGVRTEAGSAVQKEDVDVSSLNHKLVSLGTLRRLTGPLTVLPHIWQT